MRELRQDEVETMLRTALAHGHTLGKPMSAVVVDPGGHLRGALRADKGRVANMGVAEKKAWTSATWQRTTEAVRAIMAPDRPGHGLQFTDNRICTVGGGFPLYDEAGDLLGAIGVSGGTVDEDIACAHEAIRAAGLTIPS